MFGLTKEFNEEFWDHSKDSFINSMKEVKEARGISISQREGLGK